MWPALVLTGAVVLVVGLLVLVGRDRNPWVPVGLSAVVIVGALAAARRRAAFSTPRLRFAAPSAVLMLGALATWAVNGGSSAATAGIVLAPLVGLSVASLARTEVIRFGVSVGFALVLAVISGAVLAKWYSGDATGSALLGDASVSDRYSLGMFGHPNTLGMALAMLIPLATAGVVLCRDRALRSGFGVAGALGLGALFATQSRTAWVGCALALLVVAPNWRMRGVAIAAGVGLAALVTPGLVDRLAADDYEDNVRFDIWAAGLRLLGENPTLGVGVGRFQANSDYVQFPDQALPAPPPHAHNVLLSFGAEMGVLAACALAFLAAAVVMTQISGLRHARGIDEIVVRGGLGAMTAMIVAGQFDATIDHHYTLLLAACIVGLSCAATRPAFDGGDRSKEPSAGGGRSAALDRSWPSRGASL